MRSSRKQLLVISRVLTINERTWSWFILVHHFAQHGRHFGWGTHQLGRAHCRWTVTRREDY
jgi:hypothetical protein